MKIKKLITESVIIDNITLIDEELRIIKKSLLERIKKSKKK